jgi:hypothetical protein
MFRLVGLMISSIKCILSTNIDPTRFRVGLESNPTRKSTQLTTLKSIESIINLGEFIFPVRTLKKMENSPSNI